MTNKVLISSLIIFALGLNLKVVSQEKTPVETISEFKVRGFHLDLRIQVMTPEALKSFAKELAGFGINTLVLEWEATYPYEKQATISNELSYTREEVKSFIDYCQQIGIEVIPLQQCFGHVEYILRNERYSQLKEDDKDISQLCPLKIEENRDLFTDLFTDMASMHNSDYIHIGGDETYLLGHCSECSLKASNEGKSKLFVDHMKMMCEIVVKLGKKPIMWADILLKYPEAADELPKETIFIDWNYGWKTNHFGNIENLQQKGFTFWGAPAIRSHPDNWYITCWEKHFNNQRDFIPYARIAKYEGLIMTSWSTSGLYGFTWDVGNKVIDMEQIRNTYPLSGFRILVASYSEALKNEEPVNPKNFVINYGIERFGFTKRDGEKFWQSLSFSPELIVNGKPTFSNLIAEMRSNSNLARELLYNLKPLRNKKEFEHFKLMIDLQGYYLAFREIESFYNSDQFTINHSKKLIEELKELLAQSKELDQRFFELNKGFLYDSEIDDQNRIRNLGLKILYNRLTKLKG